jgi:hydroxyacylglutathione hydrolase
VSNLRFARSVEPSHAPIVTALEAAEKLRAAGEPTVGTTIGHERKTNPFVRTGSPEIRRSLEIPLDADGATALGVIREAKNAFR